MIVPIMILITGLLFVSSDSRGDSEEFDGYMSSILIYNRALAEVHKTTMQRKGGMDTK